jgi:hypothetical protein
MSVSASVICPSAMRAGMSVKDTHSTRVDSEPSFGLPMSLAPSDQRGKCRECQSLRQSAGADFGAEARRV